MQAVSNAWLEAQKAPLMNVAYVEVTIDLTDPDAMLGATLTASSGGELEGISDAASVISPGSVPKYGTLEEDLWLLDGSVLWTPDSGGSAGYVSEEICGEDGTFSTPPELTLQLAEAKGVFNGLEIQFSETFGEYPSMFDIELYDGQNRMTTQLQVGNNRNTTYRLDEEIDDVYKVVVRVKKWCLPGRRARVEKIFLGTHIVLTKKELTAFSVEQNLDLVSAYLSNSSLSFTIDNSSGLYDLDNEDGITRFFRERQRVTCRMGVTTRDGIEYINGGTFFLKTFDFQKGGLNASFTAYDGLYFLTGTYYKGLYSERGTPLYTLAENVLEDAARRIGTITEWEITNSLESNLTNAPIPVCTQAEALQYIANASGSMIKCDRNGKLLIDSSMRGSTLTDYPINSFVLLEKPTISQGTLLKDVVSMVTQYTGESEQAETLYEGTHTISDESKIVIIYSSPASGVQIATETSGSVQMTDFSAWTGACEMVFKGEGSVSFKVTGYPLPTQSYEYTRAVNNDGEDEKLSNPLVTNSGIAARSCAPVARWFANRQTVTFPLFRADPRLDTGNYVDYDGKTVVITRIRYEFTGMFRGYAEGRIIN